MLIKDLIAQLQKIEANWRPLDHEHLGPPQVDLDVFMLKYGENSANYDRLYGGIVSNDFVIQYIPHWPVPVITTFAEYYEDPHQSEKAKEPTSGALPWPESWEA